jgi:hypothetical protein
MSFYWFTIAWNINEPQPRRPGQKPAKYKIEPLGMFFSRPDVKDVFPDENELEQAGEESFWQRFMWPLIWGGLIFFLIIVIIITLKVKIIKCALPWFIYSVSPTSGNSSGPPSTGPPNFAQFTTVNDLMDKNWIPLTEDDFKDYENPKKASALAEIIISNIKVLNELASRKVLPPDDGFWCSTTLIVDNLSPPFEYVLRSRNFEDLYVGLYSSEENKNAVLTKDYFIGWGYFHVEKGKTILHARPARSVLASESACVYKGYFSAIDCWRKNILNFEDKK